MIAVVKDREIEIGYPTDVKHVAHIGLDNSSPSASAPSWVRVLRLQNLFDLIFWSIIFLILVWKMQMNEFKTGEVSERRDSSSTAVTALTHWSTHSQGLYTNFVFQLLGMGCFYFSIILEFKVKQKLIHLWIFVWQNLIFQ